LQAVIYSLLQVLGVKTWYYRKKSPTGFYINLLTEEREARNY